MGGAEASRYEGSGTIVLMVLLAALCCNPHETVLAFGTKGIFAEESHLNGSNRVGLIEPFKPNTARIVKQGKPFADTHIPRQNIQPCCERTVRGRRLEDRVRLLCFKIAASRNEDEIGKYSKQLRVLLREHADGVRQRIFSYASGAQQHFRERRRKHLRWDNDLALLR